MEKLIVSTSPHIHAKSTTQSIMRDVLIALSPAAVASIVLFGLKALLNIVLCVGVCVLSEFIFNLIVKKKQTIVDLSACVTGLILGLSLPATTGVWPCIVGSVFAIIVVKCLFGGIGCNFANPAATARVLLLSSFGMSVAGGTLTSFQNPELVSGATPLVSINAGILEGLPSIGDMLLGNRAGAVGETCIIAILLGGAYLIVRKVINWETPVVLLGTVFLLSLIIKGDATVALYELLGGGVVFAAFFMATDYSTTPINRLGKVVFAFGCGVLTVIFRFFSSLPEGISYALLIMNILSPYIEKLCTFKPLGKAGKTE
ncbi:MAG: RnfABCDGE type electron transport complex subunit D [Clostridia bacterium]|nr:RnfABCDGE type electron transport complex subunit D [Clostridia bacterium]